MKGVAKTIMSILVLLVAMSGAHIAHAADPGIAPGPQWWPGTGTTNFATPEAACNSKQFQNAYLGSSTFLFDHAGQRNEGDKRKWCWYVIVDNDGTPRAMTVVSPVCPAGSQLAASAKPGSDASHCVCHAGLSYDAEAKQCSHPKPVKGKAAKQ